MTVDNRGHLWVACFGASQVIEIDPKNGKQLSDISFDGMANNITSVAFGGSDLNDLYVTSARIGSPDNFGPKEGKLFIVRNTGAQGLPGREFNPTVPKD
jgi:gluconolactonase